MSFKILPIRITSLGRFINSFIQLKAYIRWRKRYGLKGEDRSNTSLKYVPFALNRTRVSLANMLDMTSYILVGIVELVNIFVPSNLSSFLDSSF